MSGHPLLKYRLYLIVLAHAVLVTLGWVGAWWLRLDAELYDVRAARGVDYLSRCIELLPWILVIRLMSFLKFDLFRGLWRYVSLTDLINLIKATLIGSLAMIPILALHGVIGLLRSGGFSGGATDWVTQAEAAAFENVPRMALLVIEPLLCLFLVGGVRFAIRTYREVFSPAVRGGRSVIIVGAGDAGEMVLREMHRHAHMGYDPIGFLDDDQRKWGTKIHGVPVLGGIGNVRAIVERTGAEEIMVAIPTANADQFRRILEECRSTGVRLRRLPRRSADIVRLTEVRDVNIEDLLQRQVAEIDLEALRGAVSGRVVLVTGAGGSIGSEVVRQLVPLGPSLVVAVDRSENALFFLERELSVHHPELRLRVRVADVREAPTMRALFAEVRPTFVIHAAAYKHVPLMEAHPVEAVRNNVAATLMLAELAGEFKAQKFLLISSDKAVRPTNVMGATKRAAELALQSLEPVETQYVAVRFGNVLGSDGSVVPLFKRQIKEGGPVTVTHPDVVRYFMTIPEAVGLVLEAGVMGRGGEIFHLDMGQPVKVIELARRLIELSGFRPGEDIPIQIVGLRPGEKMHEELLAEGEHVKPTEKEGIRVLATPEPDRPQIRARIEELLSAASVDRRALIRALKALVPEYQPNNDEFQRWLS